MLLAKEFATRVMNSYTPLSQSIESMSSLHWHSNDVTELSSLLLYRICNNITLGFSNMIMPVHTVRHTQNILHIRNVNVLHWPARSPDLSPIERLWDHLGRQVRECHDVNNIPDLERALQAEWVRIPWQVIRKLICSMRQHCLAVLATNGGHTRYLAISEFLCLTPSSFHIRLRLNAAKLWNNIDASHW